MFEISFADAAEYVRVLYNRSERSFVEHLGSGSGSMCFTPREYEIELFSFELYDTVQFVGILKITFFFSFFCDV